MSHKLLSTDMDFFGAAISQVKVYVVKSSTECISEIVDHGGIVEKYTSESIKISGAYFFRKQYEFRVVV